MNNYEILGVEPSADKEIIRKAYLKLSLKHHPDKGGNKDDFAGLQNAYEILSDPNKRREYDDALKSEQQEALKSEQQEAFKREYAATTNDKMNYYQVLSVEKNASQEQIEEAYQELKAVFQGDKNYRELGKRIQAAHRELSDPEKRRAYDIRLEQEVQSQEAFKREYAATTNDKMDYYQVLSVEKNASQEQIEEAYQELKAVFQGDKNYRELGKRIQAAHRELSDPEKRRAYDDALEQNQMRETSHSPVTVVAVEEVGSSRSNEERIRDRVYSLRKGLDSMNNMGFSPGYGYSQKSQENKKGKIR